MDIYSLCTYLRGRPECYYWRESFIWRFN